MTRVRFFAGLLMLAGVVCGPLLVGLGWVSAEDRMLLVATGLLFVGFGVVGVRLWFLTRRLVELDPQA